MKIYVTKYALSTGIEQFDAEIKGNMAVVAGKSACMRCFHGKGNDWHLNARDALAKAEEMRIKRLQSIDKQIKKISAINFEDQIKALEESK